MKAIKPALMAIATAFSIGIANAEPPREAEVVIVTAPKPRPADILIVAPRAEIAIDLTSLRLEPPRLEPPTAGAKRHVELALADEAKRDEVKTSF